MIHMITLIARNIIFITISSKKSSFEQAASVYCSVPMYKNYNIPAYLNNICATVTSGFIGIEFQRRRILKKSYDYCAKLKFIQRLDKDPLILTTFTGTNCKIFLPALNYCRQLIVDVHTLYRFSNDQSSII